MRYGLVHGVNHQHSSEGNISKDYALGKFCLLKAIKCFPISVDGTFTVYKTDLVKLCDTSVEQTELLHVAHALDQGLRLLIGEHRTLRVASLREHRPLHDQRTGQQFFRSAAAVITYCFRHRGILRYREVVLILRLRHEQGVECTPLSVHSPDLRTVDTVQNVKGTLRIRHHKGVRGGKLRIPAHMPA